jgi:ankyrin repeat protein
MWASEQNQVAVVDALVAAGADVCLEDKVGVCDMMLTAVYRRLVEKVS